MPKNFNSVLYAMSLSLNATCGFREISVLLGMIGHWYCFFRVFIWLLCETMCLILFVVSLISISNQQADIII